MELFATIFAMTYQLGDAFAFLVISCAGLAVIFGMMGIINLAHGEFIMCGAYVTAASARAGLPLPLAILCGALVAGIVGMAIERTVVRHLYHRPLDSIIATWGISLIATQGVLIVLGSTMQGIGTPLGSITVGDRSYSAYRLVLMAAAIGLLVGLIFVFGGAGRIDPAAKGKGLPWRVRLIILPGIIGLWPIMLAKLFMQKEPPIS